MPRMLDLIRDSRLPSDPIQFAARRARLVPPGERDEEASLAGGADLGSSGEVLGYFVSPANLRISLLPALAENQSVEEAALNQLALLGSRSVVEVLLTSARVMNSPRLLQALQSNAHVHRNELAEIAKKPAGVEPNSAAEAGATEADAAEADAPNEVVESTVAKYLEENAAELAE